MFLGFWASRLLALPSGYFVSPATVINHLKDTVRLIHVCPVGQVPVYLLRRWPEGQV